LSATITPAAMSGSFNGVPWSIQPGTPIIYESGGANQENVLVVSVTPTSFTAIFQKSHAAGVAMLVNSYNQLRQAAGAIGSASVRSGGNSANLNIAAATVVKASAGRTVRVSVTQQGTSAGSVNDCATTGAAATS